MRPAETARAYAVRLEEESRRALRMHSIGTLRERASISSDRILLLLRDEGWKEVKMRTFHSVEVTSRAMHQTLAYDKSWPTIPAHLLQS